MNGKNVLKKTWTKKTHSWKTKTLNGGNIVNKKKLYAVGAILIFIMLSLCNIFVDNGRAIFGHYEYNKFYELNESPHAVACSAPNGYTGITGELITLDGSTSYDNDGYVVKYSWHNGCEWTHWHSSPTTTFSKETGGVYTVRLKVMDDDGAVCSPSNALVYINPSGSRLQLDVEDNRPIIGWCEDEKIDFNVTVGNLYTSANVYWFDVELDILDRLIHPRWIDDSIPSEFNFRCTNEDPYEPGEDPPWQDICHWVVYDEGIYYIKGHLDWGQGTDDDSDNFWVHWCSPEFSE